MSEFLAKLNPYVRKARLYPALMLTLPMGITFTLLWPSLGIERLIPLAVAAGLPSVVTNIVRGQGQRLELCLERRWGGMPTTQLLRLTNEHNNPDLLRRRRGALQELIGEELPTIADEHNRPKRSDERYVAATRLLITKVRDNDTEYPRVREELANYGFWRSQRLVVHPWS